MKASKKKKTWTQHSYFTVIVFRSLAAETFPKSHYHNIKQALQYSITSFLIN